VAIWFSRYVLAGELSNSMDAGVCMAVLEDRRGRVLDNLFIERLWGSVKNEDVFRRTCPSHLRGRAVDSLPRGTPGLGIDTGSGFPPLPCRPIRAA